MEALFTAFPQMGRQEWQSMAKIFFRSTIIMLSTHQKSAKLIVAATTLAKAAVSLTSTEIHLVMKIHLAALQTIAYMGHQIILMELQDTLQLSASRTMGT